MAKRTGLGRGIGALIPTTEMSEDRPVDVFFPSATTTAPVKRARTPVVEQSEKQPHGAARSAAGKRHRPRMPRARP
ncbi:hypothetical protein GCM10023087_10310 [Microbacterium rhizosphaerae]